MIKAPILSHWHFSLSILSEWWHLHLTANVEML